MLCVDYARESFDDPIVTFAALLHDLGKGTTPKSEWPKHIGHEQRGLPLVQAVSARLKVPKEYEILAKLVCEHHLKCHTLHQLKASTALKLLEQLDAFRKPGRIERFAKACEADARGRTGMASNPYLNRQLLMDFYLAARSVDIKPLLEAGYQGEKLGDQIRQHRIEAIGALGVNK
jgi:tRNA nucleotidyltransferase (CCA-adding enzyme)